MDNLTVYYQPDPAAAGHIPDTHQDVFSKTTLGFWIYLMTDCLLFATLFLVYAVLHNNTHGGPSSRDLFDLSTAFIETLLLLCSSVTCGFAMLSAVQSKTKHVVAWLVVTALLGAAFLILEGREFAHLIHQGHTWTKSAFLSAFFTLVATHGCHISVGLLWGVVMLAQIALWGINPLTFRRLALFSMFWHFLDVIWIFIFTFVYLMGVL